MRYTIYVYTCMFVHVYICMYIYYHTYMLVCVVLHYTYTTLYRSVFGEDALVNVSVERKDDASAAEGKLAGYIRIRYVYE